MLGFVTLQVEVTDGKVKVKCDPNVAKSFRRQREMCCSMPDEERTILIVGGGMYTFTLQ